MQNRGENFRFEPEKTEYKLTKLEKILFDTDLSTDNWSELFSRALSFIDSEQNLSDTEINKIKGNFAIFLEKVVEQYYKDPVNDLKDFKKELSKILAKNKKIILSSYTEEIKYNKRQPSFIESVEATIERLEMLEKIQNIFKNFSNTIIVGGSLIYGPFYNVRDNKDTGESSDIDILVIVDEQMINDEAWGTLPASKLFDDKEVNTLMERRKIFTDLYKKGDADIFSQKIKPKNRDYDVSIHFFTPKIFDRMIGDVFVEDINSQENKIVTLKDYKTKKYPRKTCMQPNFKGQPYAFNVPKQKKTELGVIASLPSYIISDGEYHPGIYQNLMLPHFPVYYDKDNKNFIKVDNYKRTLINYLRQKKGNINTPDDIANCFIEAHARKLILSPELKKNITTT